MSHVLQDRTKQYQVVIRGVGGSTRHDCDMGRKAPAPAPPSEDPQPEPWSKARCGGAPRCTGGAAHQADITTEPKFAGKLTQGPRRAARPELGGQLHDNWSCSSVRLIITGLWRGRPGPAAPPGPHAGLSSRTADNQPVGGDHAQQVVAPSERPRCRAGVPPAGGPRPRRARSRLRVLGALGVRFQHASFRSKWHMTSLTADV